MKGFIDYFLNRPVIANALMFGLIISSVVLWPHLGKEEMPEFAMNFLRANIRFPGASAYDVELFITKPIEEKLKGVSALREVQSTSAYASSSFRIVFEPNLDDLQEKIQEVKDAIDSVDFPQEADEPVYRQFRSSEKAIIDIGVFLKDKESLEVPERIELQKYALAFKNKILSLPQISGVDETGYLRPELLIKVKPEKLVQYEISLNQVKAQIQAQNVRRPVGSMKDPGESEVNIMSELNSVNTMEQVIVSSGFQGQQLKLRDLAQIENGFEKTNTINKVQGREGIIFNIKKSSNVDILTAQKAVVDFIEKFKHNNQKAPVDFVLIDDESYDVRNRLALISTNGLIGFILILFVLFCFLDFKSGFWVAMGIPFSLAFTLIASMILGYTVNNMTLAAIIIVLGIVVDDAIIVAENISRQLREEGNEQASQSVLEVASPVIASVLTTCAAFVPLYFFSGRFGMFVKALPAIIFLMLFASIIESFLVLPSHMLGTMFFEKRKIGHKLSEKIGKLRESLMLKLETRYQALLQFLLKFRWAVLSGFLALLVLSGYIFQSHLKYVMFPREESRDFRLKVIAPRGTNKYQMAKKVKAVEDVFLNDQHNVVTSVRTSIGQNRRGGEVKENEASVRVEIVPPSDRNISLNKLLVIWGKQTDQLPGFEKIRYQKGWFGSDSGSPIAIEIQENNDQFRNTVVEKLKLELENIKYLTEVEVEKPITKQEFRLDINRAETSRLGINFDQLSTALRSYIEGDILYTLNSGEEEVDVRFTSSDESKDDIQKILDLTVANSEGYLVPMKNLVTVERRQKPANINRVNFKRATTVYADLAKGTEKTPLELAVQLEQEVFPKILNGFPSTHIEFRGEIEDSRESKSDFSLSIFMVLGLIYILLIFLFDSFLTPLLIGAIIPFGVVGTALTFFLHGHSQYGFFAVVGTLGMIGVVINDSIVLVDKLNVHLEKKEIGQSNLISFIAQISSSRLRAILITTLTTVAGLFPTAYGLGGYDSMLAEMMLAMSWGLLFGMFITLILLPCLYSIYAQYKLKLRVE